MTKRKEAGFGMNWIRPSKRLSLYLRDGLACCYCGNGIEDGAKLTLDHLRPYSSGGTNNPTNLITACCSCNSSRGKRSWKAFASARAARLIEQTRYRAFDVPAAKAIIERRGGFTAALFHAPQTLRRAA